MNRALLLAASGLLATLAICGVIWKLAAPHTVRFDTPFQAVLLDNGQVYYGKIQGLGTPFPVLEEIYYVQDQVDPDTKQVKHILVRRGNEWHAPDRMVINSSHVILVEPVTPGSKVAKLIEDLNKRPQ
jgi:hypothetical protein